MKVCKTCNNKKDIAFFHKQESTKDGLRPSCKECRSSERKANYEKNKEKVKLQSKQWYEENKEKKLATSKKWKEENSHHYRKQQAEYGRKNNKEIVARKREKRKSCPITAMVCIVRSRIKNALLATGERKTNKTFDMIGCSADELKTHIERQFLKGMDWSKRSEIHIDHIVPLSSAKTKEDMIKLCHFTNLRPVWAKDNLKKGSSREFLI